MSFDAAYSPSLFTGRTVGLGRISVNSLAQLKQLQTTSPTSSKPSLHDLDRDRGIEAESKELPWRPGFGADCKIFPLDYCSTCGHTCLVYDVAPSNEHADGSCSDCSVWLLDLSLQWHRLSDSFSEYFRQAVVHLGLRQWPYALTTNHLSPQYEVTPFKLHTIIYAYNGSDEGSLSGVHLLSFLP